MSFDTRAAARRLRTIELEEFGGIVTIESWTDALRQIDQERENLLHGLVDAAQKADGEGLARARDAASTAALLLLALAEKLR